MYVIFENDGEVDLTAITSFGVSVKDSTNPIGYFGTGVKYATAILCRIGCDLKVFSGKEVYEFTKKSKTIRDQEFDLVHMNDKELSYTTELGRNWGVWQAYREIYCNCIDEGGVNYISEKLPEPKPNKTYFIVKGNEFLNMYHMKHTVVLDLKPEDAFLVTSECEVYDKPSQYIYYRGVRVLRLQEKSIYTYNLTQQLQLTEDRTLVDTYQPRNLCRQALAQCKEEDYISRAILVTDQSKFEDLIDWSWLRFDNVIVSDKFKELAEKAFTSNNENTSRSFRNYYRFYANEQASRHYKIAELSSVQEKQLNKCVDTLKVHYPEIGKYPIKIVESLGQSTMGIADQMNQKIVISKMCFEKGTKFLFSTIFEEFVHLHTGFEDQTRSLQTWLFDHICTLLEEKTGEAL